MTQNKNDFIANKKIKKSLLISSFALASTLFVSQSSIAGPIHAFYADEHNTSPTTPTGNRILEIDLESMSLANSLNVPGILGHHADNGYNSKIYAVPKGSGFVNVVKLSKDQSGTTDMQNTKQIPLIHKPRSGDAFNKKYNIILMAASNRPMGSFINVDSDKVVGTIGENVDCTLTDGTKLLSHADANTIAGATKYQCTTGSHGGTQVSGHPYWLTPDYAAIVDRTNRQISVYKVWQAGGQIESTLVNHIPTRTSVHQIVPRDRTQLPGSQKADFYAVEEGDIGTSTQYGIPEALIKMKLTTSGLQLVKRLDLQRAQVTDRAKSDRVLQGCKDIYFKDRSILYPPSMWFGDKGKWSFEQRKQAFKKLFAQEGIVTSQTTSQSEFNDFPVECLHAGIPGGHNADFAPDNQMLHVGMAGGMMSVVDVDRMFIVNNVDAGAKSGPGHTCFSKKYNVGIVSNHKKTHHRIVAYYNRAGIQGRPTDGGRIELNNFNIINKEGLTDTYQSHTCYIDKRGDYYYNFFTDGGVFYKIDMKIVADWAYGRSKNRNFIVSSLYTGGIPIQGSFIDVDSISSSFTANNDTAKSNGSAITIHVLANDSGANLTLEEVDIAQHGQVSISNGQLNYKPNLGFSGTDTFWYGISSSTSNTWEWASVTVIVTSVVPPTVLKANKDTANTTAGTAVTLNILANDTGTGLRTGWIDEAVGGSLSNSNGVITYTPRSNFNGEEDLWYELIDASGETTWGNIVITVDAGSVPTTVVANDDLANVKTGATVTIDVIANDTGRSLEIYEVDRPWMGRVRIVNNKIVYTASSNLTGTIDIWYGVKDPSWNDSWAKITVTVTR